MHTLKVNRQRCVDCGDCEVWLPGLLDSLRRDRLLISDSNFQRQRKEIEAAVEKCPLSCITVEDDLKHEYRCTACYTSFDSSGSGAPVIACPNCHEQAAKRLTL